MCLLKIIALFALSVCFAAEVSPEDALTRLKEGNRRFAEGLSKSPNRTVERRLDLRGAQYPFAVVVACSDSRVAPEIIFDQGLGDLFVVQDAGNIVGGTEMDSINYAVLHLKTPLVMVVGHEECGAVMAVIKGQDEGIPEIAKEIRPAVERSAKMWGNRWENAIKENVRLSVEALTHYPAYQDLIKKGQLRIEGGYYDFNTGRVEPVNL